MTPKIDKTIQVFAFLIAFILTVLCLYGSLWSLQEEKYECPVCHKKFQSAGYLDSHYENKHRVIKIEIVKEVK